MTTLVASLGSGKGTWISLLKLIESTDWERIILIANPFFANKFLEKNYLNPDKKDKTTVIILDSEKMNYNAAINKLAKDLSDKIVGVEVALNLLSGTGKEHMIILASLLKLGFGIRLVDFEDNKMKELAF